MTPAILQMHRDEYRKRLISGLQWTEVPTPNGYYHIQFDAKKFLSRFSEEDATAIAAGVELPKEYRKEKRFANLRKMLDGLSPADMEEICRTYNEEPI